METVVQIGIGEFGPIYEGVRGKEAVDFLLKNKNGEIPCAMWRADLGCIDFVYGKTGEDGYGLAHISEYHSEILPYLEKIIREGEVFKQSTDRVLILNKVPIGKGVAVLRLDWNGASKQWLVTAF